MISEVRPYFRRIMKELGFEEWRRSLEPDNMPKTQIKNLFHMKTGSISGIKQNQRDVEVGVPITVTFATKAIADEAAAYEKAEETIERIVIEALDPVTRGLSPLITRIAFNSAEPEALATSNDNVLLSRVNFTAYGSLEV